MIATAFVSIQQNSPDSEDNPASSSSNASGGSTGSTVNASKPVPPIAATAAAAAAATAAAQQKCSICGKVLEKNNRFHERQCKKRQEILEKREREEAKLEEESKRNYGYFDEKGEEERRMWNKESFRVLFIALNIKLCHFLSFSNVRFDLKCLDCSGPVLDSNLAGC